MKSRPMIDPVAMPGISAPLSVGSLLLAAVFWIAPGTQVRAQIYNAALNRAIDINPPPAGYIGVNLYVRSSSSANAAFLNGNTAWWFDYPANGDIDWRNPFSGHFQYTKFSSEDGTVKNAYMLAVVDGAPDQVSPKFTTEHFSLENVNFDPRTVQIRLQGSALSWTMSNSRFASSQGSYTPTFYAPAPLTLSSVGGSNELVGWSGLVASVTSLNVAGGTSLKFTDAGDIDSTSSADQLRFELAGNKADINGGTLTLNRSGVVFVTGASATVNAGVVTEGFVVRNGGSLVLEGTTGSLAATKLEVFGSMLVNSSSIELADRTKLILNETFPQGAELKLNNANVTVNNSALLSAPVAYFSGTNTVTSTNPSSNSAGFQAGFALENTATTVNVRGAGLSFAKGAFVLNGGTVAVNNGSTLVLKPAGGQGLSNTTGRLEIASGATVDIDQGYTLSLGGGLHVDNQGTMNVLGALTGTGTMTGPGDLVVDEGGTLSVSNQSFTVAGDVGFRSGSELHLRLDSVAQTLQSLFAKGLSFNTGELGLPSLSFFMVNDTVLPPGVKFLLADYDTFNGGQFNGLADGSVFQQGLNTYQIRYSDADYGASHGGNSSVITLTVVPSPYETWMAGYPGVPAGKRGPTDDGDCDGVANVVEFAHKGDPSNPASMGLAYLVQDASASAGNEFTLVVAMRDGAVFGPGPNGQQIAAVDGITCAVEGSLDLATFPGASVSHIGGPSDTAPAATGLPDLSGTEWEYHTFKLDASEGLLNRGFMRTRVEVTTAP